MVKNLLPRFADNVLQYGGLNHMMLRFLFLPLDDVGGLVADKIVCIGLFGVHLKLCWIILC